MRLLHFPLVILFFLHSSQPGVVYRKPDGNGELETGGPLPGTRGLAVTFHNRKVKIWPSAIVYYQFHRNVGQFVGQIVQYSIKIIQDATSNVVKFQYDATKTKGVIVVYQNCLPNIRGPPSCGSCYSDVGYHENTTQKLVLTIGEQSNSCAKTNKIAVAVTIHELLHALGFVHEFQRHDRDQYIIVNKNKIKQDNRLDEGRYQTNYGLVDDDTKNLPFDYKSIMQYDLNKKSIVVEDKPGRTGKVSGGIADLGHLCGISAGDRNLIERTYYKASRGPNATLIKYTTLYQIPGGVTCKDTLDVMEDEKE